MSGVDTLGCVTSIYLSIENKFRRSCNWWFGDPYCIGVNMVTMLVLVRNGLIGQSSMINDKLLFDIYVFKCMATSNTAMFSEHIYANMVGFFMLISKFLIGHRTVIGGLGLHFALGSTW